MASIDPGTAAARSVWPAERRLRTTLVGWALAALAGTLAVLVGMTVLFGPAAVGVRVAGAVVAARCGTCLLLWAASATARERMTDLV